MLQDKLPGRSGYTFEATVMSGQEISYFFALFQTVSAHHLSRPQGGITLGMTSLGLNMGEVKLTTSDSDAPQAMPSKTQSCKSSRDS